MYYYFCYYTLYIYLCVVIIVDTVLLSYCWFVHCSFAHASNSINIQIPNTWMIKRTKDKYFWRNKMKSLLKDRNELLICSEFHFNKPNHWICSSVLYPSEMVFLSSCSDFIDNLTTVIMYLVCFSIIPID